MRLKFATALSLSLAALAIGGAGPTKPYKITFIQSLAGNPFYDTVACGAREAAKRLGVTLDVQAPQQYQAALQMRVLDAVIAAHPDGILFAASDPVALTPTLKEAKEQGIKILSIDGDVSDMSIAIGNIQSDNVDGGKQAAQRLAQLIGDKGEVLALMNTPAPTVSAQRLDGFKTELAANHPNITFLGVQYSGNQTSKAASIVTSTIAAHPDLAGIFTITTNNTEGAATGLREAQRVGKVQIVGFDTSDPIVEDIRSGIVAADVVQFPYRVGQLGVEMMVNALDGKPVEREVHTPFVVATPQTIDTPDVQKFVYKTHCS
jgi:ribose transport system substrate-binding protein